MIDPSSDEEGVGGGADNKISKHEKNT